jgi:hypothetical protein
MAALRPLCLLAAAVASGPLAAVPPPLPAPRIVAAEKRLSFRANLHTTRSRSGLARPLLLLDGEKNPEEPDVVEIDENDVTNIRTMPVQVCSLRRAF